MCQDSELDTAKQYEEEQMLSLSIAGDKHLNIVLQARRFYLQGHCSCASVMYELENCVTSNDLCVCVCVFVPFSPITL